jgi:hypothetical protein
MWPESIINQITPESQLLPDKFICPLTSYSIIEVKGEEAAKFLQGQLSCDVHQASETQFCLGTHNTPKGRIISSFRFFAPKAQCYWLLMAADLAETALKALNKYIVFSKATACIRDDLLAFISIGNPLQEDVPPEFNYEQQQLKPTGLIAQISAFEQPQTLLHIGCIDSVTESLSTDICTIENENTLLQLQYEQGLAFIHLATTDLFIAQMLNYQHTSAINFKKGCYTGQEIVARTHYKGNIKRKLFKLSLNSDATFNPGDELCIATPDKLKTIATIAAAFARHHSQQDLLVVSTADILELPSIFSKSGEELTINNAEDCNKQIEHTV